jgi:PIN domain nuclease of toxin-antitoxin system
VPLSQVISRQQQVNSLQILPIELAHIFALEQLPNHHRDPFDRLLIAQAFE